MVSSKTAVETGVVRAKNARQKRKLLNEAPKVFENAKKTLFIKGGNVSDTITSVFTDLHRLKSPHSLVFKKKNIVRPFEDASSLEFFSKKTDSSLIGFGSHNKKRPHNFVIARTFDHQILDMVEMGIGNYVALNPSAEIAMGTKPMLSFAGDAWENELELKDGSKIDFKRIRNLFVDFFRGDTIDNVRRTGLELLMQFTLQEGVISMRSYKVIMKKSGQEEPRVELESIGLNMDLTVRRTQLTTPANFKKACKQPAGIKEKNKKNITKDGLTGEVRGTVHLPSARQNLDEIALNHKKVMKRPMPEKEIDSEDEKEFEQDVEMDEL